MEREQAISRIKAAEPAIRSLGASALYLFGSTSRNEARPGSDVDVYIDRDASKPFGMMQLTELEFLLEQILGTEVDLATRTSLHPMLREEIEKSAIRVL
jgi:predicted nucleotidyltransferase